MFTLTSILFKSDAKESMEEKMGILLLNVFLDSCIILTFL
jgi:hypothetical protein